MSAFGIMCTVAWTELWTALRADGGAPSEKCGPHVREWIEKLCRRELEQKPIDMILFCPMCGVQHVDAPEPHHLDAHFINAGMEPTGEHWTNPPHRSHLCHECGCIWRPADVPTNGVKSITTKGSADNFAERRALLRQVLR